MGCDATLNSRPAVAPGMSLDRLEDLSPDEGEVLTAELAVNDDVLVKQFSLGPDAEISPHAHDESTNVFHVLRGRVTVVRDESEEEIDAPGVVENDRGAVHGARNEGDETAVLTACLCPFPS